MSLLLTAAAVLGGAAIGRWLARREWRKRRGARGGGVEAGAASAENSSENEAGGVDGEPRGPRSEAPRAHRSRALPAPPNAPKSARPRAPALSEFPCHLGDVLLRTGGGEAWLAGALVFAEELPVSALFVAPDAPRDVAIYARPRPRPELAWLFPVASGEIKVGAEPPTSLEHQGVRFERARRLPVHVERWESGAPDVGERAIVAEYTSPGGERLLVVTGSGECRAWRGTLLEDGMYDSLPSATPSAR